MLPLWIGLLLLNLVRLAFLPAFDLFPQEAYYALYAKHLSLSYFDHPPVLAYLLRLFLTLLGHHRWAVRLTAFTVTALTQLAYVALVRAFLPVERRATALLLLLSSAVCTLLALISLPDTPLLLFWTLSSAALRRALFEGHRASWLTAGVCMGLAFDSKYTAVFLPLGLVLFLLSAPEQRQRLREPWPWLCIAVMQLMAAPVYLWNYQHQWASFRFQTAGRAATAGFGFAHLSNLLGGQLLLLGPAL